MGLDGLSQGIALLYIMPLGDYGQRPEFHPPPQPRLLETRAMNHCKLSVTAPSTAISSARARLHVSGSDMYVV
jgi:hypothetical protein